MRKALFGLMLAFALSLLLAAPAGATEEQAAVARANRDRIFQGTPLNEEQQEEILRRIAGMPAAVPWDDASVRSLFDGVVYTKAYREKILDNFYAVWVEHLERLRSRTASGPGGEAEPPGGQAPPQGGSSSSGARGSNAGTAHMSPLNLGDLTKKILELSNWFFSVAGVFLAVIIAWRGLSLAFTDSPNRRSEIKDLFLQIVVGGSLVFGSWLVVAVLKGLFLD